jgi:AcrR family transcriptional regulator
MPKSGSVGETSRSISAKNAAAPARDVIEIIWPPPGPNRNQCVDPPGMCTRVPGGAARFWSASSSDVRANQKNRARAAIIEAAAAMMREGRPPTVAEAAERALVSRATAYRYFPTQESLLLDVVNVEALVKPTEDLVASFPTDDAAQRLAALVDTFMTSMLSDEALIRTGERVYMDTWLANQRDGNDAPVRAGRRMRYIDEALRPLGERLAEPGRKRLRSALALALGTEALIAMKDVAGLDDDEEIVATLQWAASAFLRTALHDFGGSQ